MYLSEIQIKNFRQFGDTALIVKFQPGVIALVGSNDSGKTAIIDAIRYVLSTRDHEYIYFKDDDFHIDQDGNQTREFSIRCTFSGLSKTEASRFVEFITPLDNDFKLYKLYITLAVVRKTRTNGKSWN
ncbi:MAG: AAA family ATPase, partial [Bifidobacterium aquikefiri]